MMIGGRDPIPIINVFTFQDGRIVEIWNHRHDVDIGFVANVLSGQGFVAGVLATLAVGFFTVCGAAASEREQAVLPAPFEWEFLCTNR